MNKRLKEGQVNGFGSAFFGLRQLIPHVDKSCFAPPQLWPGIL